MAITSLIFILLKNWWWVPFPFIFLRTFSFMYLWWIRWEIWYQKIEWVMLEIIPPAETQKPFRAMEDLISSLWGLYDRANWRERWCEGQFEKAPFWFSFEIASIGGKIHFFARVPEAFKEGFTSALQAHYPEAEVIEAEDYTQKIPKDAPNEEWEINGEEYNLVKPDFFPIKTYQAFFEEKPELEEEKRIDPQDALLEALSKLQPNEQFWFQIVLFPILERDVPFKWIKKGEAFISALATGTVGKKPEPIGRELQKGLGFHEELKDVISFLISGRAPSPPPPSPPSPFQEIRIRLTPGEIKTATEIGRKISKPAFKTILRAVHLYNKKTGPVPPAEHRRIVRAYMIHFGTQDLNMLMNWGPTRVRIHYWFVKRRLYLRKRRLFRYYIERLPLSFPWNMDGNQIFPPFYPKGLGRQPILNAEEIATIFHLPQKVFLPEVPRVEVKKRGLPPEIISEVKEKRGPPPPFLPT